MSSAADSPEARRGGKRLYGRAAGKPLSARQQGLVDHLLPKLDLPEDGPVDPARLNPGCEGQVLEIGFGGGEHLAQQAERRPGWGFIGIEPFLNGVAKALTQIEEAGLDNVRIHRGDAREVMPRMPDAAFDEIYLLFPDPWPKSRHAKRRFVQAETRDEFARLLKLGGRLRIATDVKSYADHVMVEMQGDGRFSWRAQIADDWRIPPADHIRTRYESKGLGDCAPVFMDFWRA